jgi:alkanesulfonate monooxygenase SsuD/methylene tetrahydromethanopterin reductase-like flavin-dependent oxidoreductase (luciferase family)
MALPEQHSKQDNIDPSPNLLAARVLSMTKKIKVLPYGAILPLHNPLRIAEEYAMLDVLSKGRLLAGFVRGGPTNYLAYGLDYFKASESFEEAWDLIVKAWTTHEPFEWKGKHYHFDKVSVWPRPYQKPHPPLHTAGGGSAEHAARNEATIGLGFTTTDEEVRAMFGKYTDAYREAHGRAPPAEKMAVARSVYVAETDAEAREECERHILHQYRVLYKPSMVANQKLAKQTNRHLYWADRLFLTEENYEGLVSRGNHIAGNPETVLGRILEQKERLGFGAFLGLFRYGDMPHDKAVKSMKLFAEQVMPALRAT